VTGSQAEVSLFVKNMKRTDANGTGRHCKVPSKQMANFGH
jgi:hypothetical protein